MYLFSQAATEVPKELQKLLLQKKTGGGVQVGLGIFERTQILSGIQFTTHFIEFVVVETKRFVGSTVNVILMRQTCGQHSSSLRAAERQRRARENSFPSEFAMCS